MEKKRWCLIFKAKSGYYRRTVYSVCTEEELQGAKEAWAMIIEEEIRRPVICEQVKEAT